MIDLTDIKEFLRCDTPDSWVESALANPALMLLDHANCEKKAASTAIHLMYRYVDDFELLNKMSRLAREELRHFEQVIALMEKRGIAYEQITASRYAAELRKPVRTHEPGRLIDTLIVGAIIEARSCERFAKLAPHLDTELQSFYVSLLKSEARHFKDYLGLARKAAGGESIEGRVDEFLTLEENLVQAGDSEFRFHSGPVALA
ncbi:tRNA-(ms[2]io[6]A)-hydroxylase [Gilvimarinus xylanilyticus]|uniref:tRNA-(Ms[2]io[6]A)-hydroxylase n=1 Tax=Gilvimarinus xylanilyticus TaxID=2944139 RepID=A0A9X2KT38_9GAMM|nr:tRNA-(ms[2]io[6]A)-hydroxylase [Gilvimarinus xylanilyticus]MCP8898378.1 tRNA-(ms[2]io[6]A)-hydroxylase [Gilvimarinus xylanilyticus]